MKAAVAVLILSAWSVAPALADSLSENTIIKEITAQSVLPLRADVADMWADNLLFAQLPANCSYCANEPDSLPLSIHSLLKAITIEQDPVWGFGQTYCNLDNCWLANLTSTIAIDDGAALSITPSSINFGDVPVGSTATATITITNTPEPRVWLLLLLGLSLLALARVIEKLGEVSDRKKAYEHEFSNHPYRKA